MATVIRGATVYDGSGSPGVVGDVVVDGDRIAEASTPATTVVDGTGLALAPGFVDTHTHDDFAAVLYPDMAFKVRGGVTTCVVGNCGIGAAPWRSASSVAGMFHPGHDLPEWDGFAGYLARLDANPAAVNVAALAGHGTIRASVVGWEERPVTADELDGMRVEVAVAMDAGCFGLSSGLIYPPGRAADTDELVALAEVVAAAGGRYTTHMRDEADGLLDSVDEAIEIGRRADIDVVISHLKAQGRANWGRVRDALDRIDAAGPRIAADQYPYTASSTNLAASLRTEAATPENIADIVIATTDHHPEWHGRSLADLVDVLGVTAGDVADQVLAAEPGCIIVRFSMSEDDVRTVLGHDGIMIGSDGIPSLDAQPHPRLYGSFARVLGRYARDEGVLDLAAAVHRMTGLPASVFGLTDRGTIRPGAHADLVLFDPAAIADTATYDEPQQYPAGIVGVWVNGTRVVDQSDHTGALPGRALRHGRP